MTRKFSFNVNIFFTYIFKRTFLFTRIYFLSKFFYVDNRCIHKYLNFLFFPVMCVICVLQEYVPYTNVSVHTSKKRSMDLNNNNYNVM